MRTLPSPRSSGGGHVCKMPMGPVLREFPAYTIHTLVPLLCVYMWSRRVCISTREVFKSLHLQCEYRSLFDESTFKTLLIIHNLNYTHPVNIGTRSKSILLYLDDTAEKFPHHKSEKWRLQAITTRLVSRQKPPKEKTTRETLGTEILDIGALNWR